MLVKCHRCRKERDYPDGFVKSKGKVRLYCKGCNYKATKKYNEKNPAKVKAYRAAYYKKNKARFTQWKRDSYARIKKLQQEDKELLRVRTGGRNAFSKRQPIKDRSIICQ